MSEQNFDNSASAVIAMMRATGEVKTFAEMPGLVFLPTSEGYAPRDMRAFLASPLRASGTVLVFDPDTFNRQFIALGASALASAVFMDSNPKAPVIEGIIDYDIPGRPAWRGHRVKMEFRTTPEWDKFLSINEKPMGAAEFANFIEDNQTMFVDPVAGDLMGIVQNFEIKSDARFTHAVRLDSGGVELTLVDNPTAGVVGGKYVVPDEFIIALKPFQGSASYKIQAKFRWRQNGGDLRFFFKLLKLDDVVRDAVDDFVKQIKDGLFLSVVTPETTNPETGEVIPASVTPAPQQIPIYAGTAPAPVRMNSSVPA